MMTPLFPGRLGRPAADTDLGVRDTWALVTGATGGIGAEFARALARQGSHVVLTGRDLDRLRTVSEEVEALGVQVLSLPADIADAAARQELRADLVTRGLTITTLVNNAGFGMLGDVVDNDPGRLDQMLQLNVVALTDLTRALLPGMVAQHRGTIINVASTASFQPLPTMAAYAASKAYVRSFSIALADEVKRDGVRVVAISPGPTESGFFASAGNDAAMQQRRAPADVVETTFRALRRGVVSVVDGPLNRVGAFGASRLVPESIAARVGSQVLKR